MHVGRDVEALIKQDVTADRVLAAIDRIVAGAGHDDMIVLSFAGHGLSDKSKALRLALPGTRLDRIEETALAFSEIADRIRESKARVVVLLDVCHAGLANQAAFATNDSAVSQLVTNSGASIIVLSASKGRQFSLESRSAGGGEFSVAFSDAISGAKRKAADTNGDGAVTVSELYRAVKSGVVGRTRGKQTPWLSRNLMVGDFALF